MILKEILKGALQEGWATGHFNASELDQMKAIIEACVEVGSPAIIGTSEGERKHLGLAEAVALRDAFRKELKIPIFLNADHSKSVETAKKAADAGYDSIHIDLSEKSFEENVAGTREVVDYVKFKARKSDFSREVGLPDISVEGELGYLRGESEIQNEKIEVSRKDYTKPEEAKEFVEKTGVDRLAIVVGNIHGLSLDEPNLDIERIKEIRAVVPKDVTLVLHAGSGIPADQIKNAIGAGIANIHINTDIRIAYAEGLRGALEKDPEGVAMYKLDKAAIEAMKEVIKDKLRLFGSVNRV